jgi:hypothetical protein
LRASSLLLGITSLGVSARGIGTVKVEKAQVFFSKSGSASHTLHYSNIKQDFKVKELGETLKMVRGAVQRRATLLTFTRPLHNNETQSGHFMEDPTVKEISNSQVELIRLTSEVVNALDSTSGNIDTINHVLLVRDVVDKQVGVMESAMQAAMGGHVSVAAFTELNYARVALKINRDAKAAGLEPVVRHLSDYLQMETSFVAGPEGFSTLVHVPLIDMKSVLTIWEHHILPILLSHGLYLNLGPADYTHLAVTQDLGLRVALKINRDAKAAGLEPVARHLSDDLQMETSFVTGPEGFSKLVHVPLIDMKSALRIWEHHILPIPLSHGLYLNLGPADYTHLAVTKYPALCVFALFAMRFELASETCRMTIGGTESAMRMVSPISFGSYTDTTHRGLMTCQGTDAGGRETKSFTASGLTKITLPHGCTAETDTHIFAAADDGFSRS